MGTWWYGGRDVGFTPNVSPKHKTRSKNGVKSTYRPRFEPRHAIADELEDSVRNLADSSRNVFHFLRENFFFQGDMRSVGR